MLDNVVNLLSEKVEAKGLELLCSVATNIPATVVGDPLRLGQVLINLANNAIKFTQAGEICLGITVQQTLPGEVVLLFKVSDTGIGLTQEQIGRLFTSFAQVDASTTRQYGGTGLGLAICKNLTEAMGGSIGVESESGQGSTFWFTARLGIGAGQAAFERPSLDLRGRHVLVVDDNEAAALILSALLTDIGFNVQQVNSGLAAIEKVKEADALDQPYEFIMMDWLMPGMNGLETVRAIQAMQPRTAPFVLMVTAHRRQELIKGAQQLGIEHVLAKPVSASLMVDTMMRIMGHVQPASPARVSHTGAHSLEGEMDNIAGARILLVEDNEINQMVACELLRGVGFDVDVAENGQVAVHRVAERLAELKPYDVVLMDMQMPVMDGVTASRLLRETYSAHALPIVAMTANAMKIDRDRCIEAGMNGFITKPINPEELWQALLRWIRVRPGLGVRAAQGPVAKVPGDTVVAGLMQALSTVPDLNLSLGPQRTNDNPAFYVSLLRKFATGQADAVQSINRSLAAGDRPSAERIAHTLRGVAGNLGATALQASAEALETNLRQATPEAHTIALLAQMAAQLARLIQALQAVPGLFAIAPTTDRGDLSASERQAAEAIAGQLKVLLANDDSSVTELWETHAHALSALFSNAAHIEAAINAYDFETAITLMEESE